MNAARAPSAAGSDVLLLPQWSEANWDALFGRTELRRVGASEIVIARGATHRARRPARFPRGADRSPN